MPDLQFVAIECYLLIYINLRLTGRLRLTGEFRHSLARLLNYGLEIAMIQRHLKCRWCKNDPSELQESKDSLWIVRGSKWTRSGSAAEKQATSWQDEEVFISKSTSAPWAAAYHLSLFGAPTWVWKTGVKGCSSLQCKVHKSGRGTEGRSAASGDIMTLGVRA